MKLGIMQGRLGPPEAGRFQCFPRQGWRAEFAAAELAELETIEWIYDAYGEDVNPIATGEGISEMRKLAQRYSVAVESVCADWFMDYPLIGNDRRDSPRRWQHLGWLMEKAASLQVNRIVLPFVDASAIRTPDDADAVVEGINALQSAIDRWQVELHLETALSPDDFSALLARIPHSGVKVNYDAGNSASLGYQPREEFKAYGTRVGSVHLKDRRLGAGTVPLGEGDTDFDALFSALADVGYRGDFILQVARGAAGDELQWTRRNARTARRWIATLKDP